MSEQSERLIPGWDGRYFEDFTEGDVYRHPFGRTITTTDNAWLTLLTQNTAPLRLHPRQIDAVNEAFGYDQRQRSWAQRVVAAADTSSGAAVRVDGEMVDRPRLKLARRILASTPT
jgi:hypothetical protein